MYKVEGILTRETILFTLETPTDSGSLISFELLQLLVDTSDSV
jgi:hypothetical protein